MTTAAVAPERPQRDLIREVVRVEPSVRQVVNYNYDKTRKESSPSILFKEAFHLASYAVHFFSFGVRPIEYTVGLAAGTLKALWSYTQAPQEKPKVWLDSVSDEFSKKPLWDKAGYVACDYLAFTMFSDLAHYTNLTLLQQGIGQIAFIGYKGYSLGQDITQRTIIWLTGPEIKK